MRLTAKPLSTFALWIAGLASVALVLLAFHSSLQNLALAWQKEEYSHAWFIPLIAVFIAWHRLVETKPFLVPSWWGLVWLLVAFLMQLVAQLSAFDTLAQNGIIVAFTGLSLAFLGRAATWAIAPALVYLLFMVPLPHLIQAILSQKLQLISTSIGVGLLDLTGTSVYQEGNVIDLGTYRLQVVDACSGLRYLFPLMSFGYLIALLLNDRMWKRIVIFLSTIPITIGMNSLRLAIIGISVNMWGISMAEGFIHIFEGWTIFLACVAILLAETWLLMHIGAKGQFRYDYLAFAKGPLFGGTTVREKPSFAALLASVVFLAVMTSGIVDQRTEITPSHPPFATFPLEIGDWRGKPDIIQPDVLEGLQLSDYWIANYGREGDKAPVNFYLAYYASQRFSSQAHSPSLCVPGGGWHVDDSRVQTVELPNGEKHDVTRMFIRKGNATEIVWFWFDERGRTMTESYIAKWYLLQDSLLMHRTDGALVRMVTIVEKNETPEKAEQRLRDFLAAVRRLLQDYVPGSQAAPAPR